MEHSDFFEAYRYFFRLLNNSTSFFLTANVTILGFGANNNSAFLILIGGFFPMFILISYYLYSRVFCTIFFSAMRSNKSNDDERNYFSTLFSIADPRLHADFESIIEMKDRERQLNHLRRIKSRFIPPFSRIILVSGTVLHVLASLALWYLGDWSFA